MFSTITCIISGFTGKLRGTGEAARLVWLLFITYMAGWAGTAFAAWVSYPSYRGMVEHLPGATVTAALFTGIIAAFIYFLLAYLSGFAVEVWRGVDESARNYTRLGATIFAICAVTFVSVDFYMNMRGKDYRAREAAGEPVQFSYQTPPDQVARLAGDRYKIDQLTAGHFGGLGWKDPKTGIFHLNGSGKAELRELRRSIQRTEQADSLARVAFLADQVAANTQRDTREASITATLRNAVYGVYLFVLLFCIVQAYIVETIQAATSTTDNSEQAADGKTKLVASSRIGFATGQNRDDIEALKKRLADLEKRNGAPPENRAPIGYGSGQNAPGFLPGRDPLHDPVKSGREVIEKRIIDPGNQHPSFTTRVQPDEYRGIDPGKYKAFLKASRAVLEEQQRYNKTEIASRVGITRKTASTYLQVALKKGDLTA